MKQSAPPPPPEPESGVVGRIKKYFGMVPPPKPKVPGIGYRIKNALSVHKRGLLGWLIVFILFGTLFEKDDPAKKVELMWYTLVVLMFIRPVNIPVAAMFPIFYLPMTGTMSSRPTCSCYMNADITLFLLSSMVILLLNNSGNDRRIALAIMAFGDPDQHSAQKMVYKCSLAAYILGMLSNRLVSSAMITEYFTKSIMIVDKKLGALETEPDFEEIRFVVNNAIQISSSIGSIAILHSSTAVLCFRAIFNQCIPIEGQEYPDVFNYLQYTAFALPLSLVIFILVLIYHMVLIQRQADGEMTKASKTLLQQSLAAKKAELPPSMTLHEKLCIWGLVLALLTHAYRWSDWFGGWTQFRMDIKSTESNPLPSVKDSTVAAIFVVFLHALPNGFDFVKYAVVSKKKDFPKPKPQSGILWWKFVNKNVNYGYFFLMGGGVAIMVSSMKTGLCDHIALGVGSFVTSANWMSGIFLVVLIASFLANIISPTAACSIFLPFILCAVTKGPALYASHSYLVALAVGIATCFGYSYPFLYTPAYFCHFVGKTSKIAMIKYSFLPVLMSIIVLWLAIIFYAPLIWDPSDKGFEFLSMPGTEAEEGAAPAPPPA